MVDEVVARVGRSRRYRDVEESLVQRLAEVELARSRTPDEATKRVKRRLHQAVGAFRGEASRQLLAELTETWGGHLHNERFRAACRRALGSHASTRERLAVLHRFYDQTWSAVGAAPERLADLACGLNPLALPWMGLASTATYRACDADRRPLSLVAAFLELVEQPHQVASCDLLALPEPEPVDVVLLLKAVPTLDQQDATAAERILGAYPARHAVVSFPARSLGGRGKGMERTYRDRFERLAHGLGARVASVREASVPGELVFVLELSGG